MNPGALSGLLKSFHQAPLRDKVIIASALHYAKHGNKEVLDLGAEAWVRAIKLEMDLEHIVDLYKQGLADYTGMIRDYADIAKFVMKTLAEAIKG